MLQEACALPGSKWVIHNCMADFNKLFLASLKTHRDTYFRALATSKEKKKDVGIEEKVQTYSPAKFLKWCGTLCHEHTVSGC